MLNLDRAAWQFELHHLSIKVYNVRWRVIRTPDGQVLVLWDPKLVFSKWGGSEVEQCRVLNYLA